MWPVLLYLGLSLVLRGWMVLYPPEFDEGIWLYGGREWIGNDRPLYDAIFVGQPPVIFLVYGLAARSGLDPFVVTRLAGVIAVALIATVLMALGVRVASRRAGILAGLLFVLFASERYSMDPQILNTELMMLVFLVPAIWLSLARTDRLSLVAAGALAAMAFLSRQTAALELAALYGAILWWGGRAEWKRIGSILVGAAVPLTLVVAHFAAAGELGNLVHVGLLGQVSAGYAPGELDRVACLQQWLRLLETGTLLVVTGLASAAGLVPRPRGHWGSVLRWWLVAAFISVMASGPKYSHHLLVIVPPLALWAGIGLDHWLRRLLSVPRRRAIVCVLLILAMAAMYLPSPYTLARKLGGAARNPGVLTNHARIVGEGIRRRADLDDTILCFGTGQTPAVYYYAGLSAPTRFMHHVFLKDPRAPAEIGNALEVKPPRWLVFDDIFVPSNALSDDPAVDAPNLLVFVQDVTAYEIVADHWLNAPYREEPLARAGPMQVYLLEGEKTPTPAR